MNSFLVRCLRRKISSALLSLTASMLCQHTGFGQDSPAILVNKICPTTPVQPGGTLNYTGTVTNTGNITLTNVVVMNDKPFPVTIVFGPVTLAPNAGGSFGGSYTVPADSCGPYRDTLSASGFDKIFGVFVTSTSTKDCPGTNTPAITVNKICPNAPVPPGGTLTYSGTVANSGNITLTNVIVVNDKPAPNTLVFGPATLAPNAVATFTGSYVVPPETCAPYRDTLSASGRDKCFGVNVTSTSTKDCPNTPGIVVRKICPDAPVQPGGTLTYTGTVTNTGNVTLTNAIVVNNQPTNNTVVFGPVNLAPGAGAVFAGSYVVPTTLTNCFVTDTLTATARSMCGSNVMHTAAASCPVVTTAVRVTKNCPPTPVGAGGLLVFSGTVTNTGNVTLTNVIVVNNRPTSNTRVFGPVALAPGAGMSFTGSYMLPTTVTNCSISDTLMATARSICGNDVTHSASAICPVTGGMGSPTIVAGPQGATLRQGSNVTFTVSASGSCPLFYQWRRDGLNIFGATNSVLTLNSVGATNAGGYSVVVANAYGSAISAVAQLTVSVPLPLTATNRVPTTNERTAPVLFPISSSQLKAYVGGEFVEHASLDRTRMTVVLTHGWIPTFGSFAFTSDWPSNIAATLSARGLNANILAWDWTEAAKSTPCVSTNGFSLTNDLVAAAKQTPDQGRGLGDALANALGANYPNRIHFVGHSLGTLVNATAADYLHSHGFAPTNTHLTLFDEAEAATDLDCGEAIASLFLWDPLLPRPYYYHPLPRQSAWVDNYVSFAGLLHPEARNVILTKNSPQFGSDLLAWLSAAAKFHSYPMAWYSNTVVNPLSALMGYRWSFEQGGFAGAPPTNTVYLQGDSETDLVSIGYAAGTNFLDARFYTYRASLNFGLLRVAVRLLQSSGQINGTTLATGAGWDLVVNLATLIGSIAGDQGKDAAQPKDGMTTTNIPAYAWLPLAIPSNAVSMSFNFILQGDGGSDSFAVALNGTNVLSVSAATIETNVTLNSGLIDVSAYAGQEVEMFLGIVGGTSTNAALTVSGFQFYSPVPPSVRAQLLGGNLTVSWPLTAQGYTLEASDNLATNSWTAITNVPVIVDSQNAVTNAVSGGSRFYRLKKQ